MEIKQMCCFVTVSFLLTDATTNCWPKESYHMFKPDKLGFDRIYVIHLERRPERRQRLEKIADKLGIELSFFHALDGRNLTQAKLSELGITLMPEYKDPSKGRPMTYGEVGCSLSHHAIWEDMLRKRYQKVLILEDDALFFPMLRKKWSRISADIDELVPTWDLIFFGRKPLRRMNESYVSDSMFLHWPDYSHWCVAYALSKNGAKKLTNGNLLKNLIPVDEYIPIMYNRHPREILKKNFKQRDLIAVSTFPLLIEPAWFPVDKEYYSDTEGSKLII